MIDGNVKFLLFGDWFLSKLFFQLRIHFFQNSFTDLISTFCFPFKSFKKYFHIWNHLFVFFELGKFFTKFTFFNNIFFNLLSTIMWSCITRKNFIFGFFICDELNIRIIGNILTEVFRKIVSLQLLIKLMILSDCFYFFNCHWLM